MGQVEAIQPWAYVSRMLEVLDGALLPGPPVVLFGKEYRWLDLRPQGERLHLIRMSETGEAR